MSDFERAVEVVLRHEGEYSEDHAGATKWGIVLATLREEDPEWADRDHDGDVDADDVRALSREDAKAIYWRQWWDREGYGQIGNQAVATKVFDLAVNMGARQAHRIAQRAVRACEGTVLAEDGILGPVTRSALAVAPKPTLLAAMRSEAAGVYRLILARHPEWEGFRAGWLERAYE